MSVKECSVPDPPSSVVIFPFVFDCIQHVSNEMMAVVSKGDQ